MVDETLETLRHHAMLRSGDEARAAELRAWYEGRPDAVDALLDTLEGR
jgi:hypothetical protein